MHICTALAAHHWQAKASTWVNGFAMSWIYLLTCLIWMYPRSASKRWARSSIMSRRDSSVRGNCSFAIRSIRFLSLHVASHSVWSLIGSSFGGLVSTLVAQRQPSLIQSIVLLAPAFSATELWTSQMSVEQWRNAGFLNHFNPTSQREEPVDYAFFQDLQSHQAFPLVSSCPVTIVHGLHDAVVPIETSRDYYQQLRVANKHPTALVEVDDDHHLRKEATLHTIKSILLHNHRSIVLWTQTTWPTLQPCINESSISWAIRCGSACAIYQRNPRSAGFSSSLLRALYQAIEKGEELELKIFLYLIFAITHLLYFHRNSVIIASFDQRSYSCMTLTPVHSS